MKILFLDIDGVLVNKNSWETRSKKIEIAHCVGEREMADPPCVTALNHITDTVGARIVISSSWRVGRTLDDLKNILTSWTVTGEVIAATPRIVDHPWPVNRGEEIAAWICGPGRALLPGLLSDVVILDDDADMANAKIPLLPRRLVQTKFDEGLTMGHAQKAIALFSEKL